MKKILIIASIFLSQWLYAATPTKSEDVELTLNYKKLNYEVNLHTSLRFEENHQWTILSGFNQSFESGSFDSKIIEKNNRELILLGKIEKINNNKTRLKIMIIDLNHEKNTCSISEPSVILKSGSKEEKVLQMNDTYIKIIAKKKEENINSNL